jgi:hypothetical protein
MPERRLNKIGVKKPSKKRGARNPAEAIRPFFEPRGVAVGQLLAASCPVAAYLKSQTKELYP